jgi:predicted lipoprotein with Yx(FWY)xxD motif
LDGLRKIFNRDIDVHQHMVRTRRRMLAAIAAGASIAGCLGDDGDDDSNGGGDGETDGDSDGTDSDSGSTDGSHDGGSDGTADGSDGGMGAATVQTADHDDHGEILVDGDGLTLYMFDSDEQGAGASTCSGGCADSWPPLTVESEATVGSGVEAELTTFERDDGSTQVAANGWPLYYWQGDAEPGDATGQGVNDVWWVLDPSGQPIRPESGSSDGSTGY